MKLQLDVMIGKRPARLWCEGTSSVSAAWGRLDGETAPYKPTPDEITQLASLFVRFVVACETVFDIDIGLPGVPEGDIEIPLEEAEKAARLALMQSEGRA